MVFDSDPSSLASLSDNQVVDHYRTTGDNACIGELYRRYAHLVLGVCIKYTGNREEARDIAMGVFESLYVSLHRYVIEQFRPWLYTVTKSHCTMALRASRKHGTQVSWEDHLLNEIMEFPKQLHPDNNGYDDETIRRLLLAVGDLSPGQRDCIVQFYFDRKSYQQITDDTGFTLNEVKSHIQNGKRNLKNVLTKTTESGRHE